MPNPYALLAAGVVVICLMVGEFFFVQKITDDKWLAAVNEQKAEAEHTLATETGKVRILEGENADLNAKLEKDHADAETKIADAAHDLTDARARWMRDHPGCRPSSQSAGGSTQGAGNAQDAASGGVEELPSGSGEFIQSCSTGANEVAAFARECHAKINSMTCQP